VFDLTVTPLLFRAAEAGHAHIIRQLIPVMVKADEKATDANRAIHIAAVNGHTYLLLRLYPAFHNELTTASAAIVASCRLSSNSTRR
jgi:ankyrin repeat protein